MLWHDEPRVFAEGHVVSTLVTVELSQEGPCVVMALRISSNAASASARALHGA